MWFILKIKLSSKVLKHIIDRHPEVAGYTRKIVETVQNPDVIVKGLRGEFKALKFYSDLHIGPKYLVMVYRRLIKKRLL